MNMPVSAMEHLVLAQLRRQLEAAGVGELPAAAAAARAVLNEEELSAAEEAALEDQAFEEGVDPVALLLAERIERALRAGLDAAGAAASAPTEVLVLRGADRESESRQLGAAMQRVRRHLDERKRGGAGQLLLIAAKHLFRKVKQLVPSGKIGGLPTVEFSEDGPRETGSTAAIEVVAADVRLEAVEHRATARIAKLRTDSLGEDSMRAAWLAASKPSTDRSAPPEPAAASEPDPTPTSERETVPMPGEVADEDPMIGQLFHLKYRIVRRIGRGGFGSVYEAADERGAGNRVAIKVLSGKAAESAAQQQSFKDEARRVTRLSHPNIVDWKVFDETDAGVPYFVMELVEGEEFEETLRRERKIQPDRAARLLLQVLDALRAAHHLSKSESILHLDLKPANLFRIPARRGREEQLKVIDFGIGQYIGDEQVQGDTVVRPEDVSAADLSGPSTLSFARPPGESDGSAGVTRSKGCTPEYASPEQCEHVMYKQDIQALDGRSDLYSLGVIAFEMLTGQLPFKAKSRLDVMRMHRYYEPPKVGSMGVRVPRRLARFVDRCLQKERDARWKDTDEAHRYLYEIVNPPVWKAVAKVTVPLVLAGLIVGGWAWATREVVVPAAGLATADGVDLGARPLCLGPARPATELTLTGAEADLPDDASGRWEVLRVADGLLAAGWSASWAGPGLVSVRADATPAGRTEERVQLALDGARLRSRPLTLVWIGADAWSVPEVLIGGRPVAGLSETAVDPYGAALDLWIAGPAREDVAAVTVRSGETAPLTLQRATGSGERARYRLELADAELADGRNELALSVRDNAGTEWAQALTIDVVRADLELRRFALVDAAGERDARGERPETNRLLDVYTVSPRTSPALRIECSRPADVSWRVLVGDEQRAEIVGQSTGKRSVEADLAGLGQLMGGEPFRGRIEVTVDESPYVLHQSASGRGRVARSLAFRFEDTLPTFLASWRTGAGAEALEPGGDAAPRFTSTPNGELVLTRRQPVPMQVEAAWWPAGRPQDARVASSTTLQNPQSQQAALPLELDADGVWTVEVRAYRFDTAAGKTGERPDVVERFRLGLDREAPRVGIAGLEAGRVLRALADAPAELELRLDEPPAGAPDAPVDLRWSLTRPDGSAVASGSLDGVDPAAGAARVDLSRVWDTADPPRDGDLRLAVTGVDRAGNALAPTSVEFTLAAHGPELALAEPAGVGKWRRDPASERWSVRALASDPNGVGEVTCELLAGDTTTPIELEQEPGGSAGERVLLGSVALPYTLSEARVRLAFHALDGQGSASEWTSDEIELPTIHRAVPDRVVASVGALALEPMRLVRGNAGFRYLFGGRGDALENPDFVRAGLAAFNAAPRRSRSRSWQVPFAPGEIADYYLDEREVGVAQYLAFVRAEDGYRDARHWPAGAAPDEARRAALARELSTRDGELPVTGVGHDEAAAFAHWAGKRLPSWLEWEYAVRGGAEYRPWSGFESGAPAALQASFQSGPRPRGSGEWTPGRGIADLCSGVAEWTATAFATSDDARLYPHQWALADPSRLLDHDARGGEHWIVGGPDGSAHADFSAADLRPSDFRDATVGFRCAAPADQVLDRLGLADAGGVSFEERR